MSPPQSPSRHIFYTKQRVQCFATASMDASVRAGHHVRLRTLRAPGHEHYAHLIATTLGYFGSRSRLGNLQAATDRVRLAHALPPCLALLQQEKPLPELSKRHTLCKLQSATRSAQPRPSLSTRQTEDIQTSPRLRDYLPRDSCIFSAAATKVQFFQQRKPQAQSQRKAQGKASSQNQGWVQFGKGNVTLAEVLL